MSAVEYYDLVFDFISVEKVFDVLNNPMKFSDISSLYVKVIND